MHRIHPQKNSRRAPTGAEGAPPDEGKPALNRGNKAASQFASLIAEIPNEEVDVPQASVSCPLFFVVVLAVRHRSGPGNSSLLPLLNVLAGMLGLLCMFAASMRAEHL